MAREATKHELIIHIHGAAHVQESRRCVYQEKILYILDSGISVDG